MIGSTDGLVSSTLPVISGSITKFAPISLTPSCCGNFRNLLRFDSEQSILLHLSQAAKLHQ